MRVIDLLNKIANGEEVPKEIIYSDEKLIFDNKTKNYIYESGYDEYWTDHFIINFDLNDKIEIIEEDKEIEELNPYIKEDDLIFEIAANRKAINELIEAVNELKKGK